MNKYFLNSGNVTLAPMTASAWVFGFDRGHSINEAKALALDYLIRAEMIPEGSALPEEAWDEAFIVWDVARLGGTS